MASGPEKHKPNSRSMSDVVLAIHGGAGPVKRKRLDAEQEPARRRILVQCLERGRDLLLHGGSALDAVEQTVVFLEQSELFNAGRGSVLTAAGVVEMDAAIMDGRSRAAGAVACVKHLAHPVSVARQVMERTPHVLLVGEGAEAFAHEQGARFVTAESLITPERRAQLEQARGQARVSLDHDEETRGTVGAVARDAKGRLAAATSTGGMTNQPPGRVGDSSLIGAGTWADDRSCAVSGTGHGEAFIRSAFAHEVDAGMRLTGLPLAAACERALARIAELDARGGCIAVDRFGHLAMPFSTDAMYRGWLDTDGTPRVAIFADEAPPAA